MPFIQDESAIAGLAESSKGLAEGLERTRNIQQQNLARELALREIELKEEQVGAQLDHWADMSRQRKEQLDFNRYQFGVQTEERKRAFGLDQRQLGLQEQRFKYIQDKDAALVEREAARAEGMALLVKLMQDDELSSDELAQIDDFRDTVTDPIVLAEINTRVMEFNRNRLAVEKRQSEQLLQSNIDFLLSLKDADLVADLEMARVEAHKAKKRGILEGKVNELMEIQVQKHRQTKKLQAFIGNKSQELATPAVMSRLTEEDQFLAHELLAEIQWRAERNPQDPKLKDLETDLRVTMMDPESRKERADNLEKLAQFEAMAQPFRAAMDPIMRGRFDAFTDDHVANLKATLGREAASQDKVRTEQFWEQHRKMGAAINPEKLVGLETALPSQIRFAFRSLERAEAVMLGMNPKLAIAYRENIFARAGLDANDSALAQEYEKWVTTGKSTHMDRAVRKIDVDLYNLEVSKDSKKSMEEQYEAFRAEMDAEREASERAEKQGLTPAPVTPDEARKRADFARKVIEMRREKEAKEEAKRKAARKADPVGFSEREWRKFNIL